MNGNGNSVYEIITEKVIAQIEAGTPPWRQPWDAHKNAPRNISGRRYHGINVFLLLASGYSSPYWLTFNQIKERGGHVRKGESSTIIIFWKKIVTKDKDTGEDKIVPLLRYYRVFNLTQVDGIDAPETGEFAEDLDAEQIIKGYVSRETSLTLTEDGTAAYYQDRLDKVTMPPRNTFHTLDDFYASAFHELGHSTGHKDRLNREGVANFDHFGSQRYAREELVAEMTSAFLSAEAGIDSTFDNSAAYLAGWTKALREDTRAVVVAAGAAQRAANYILGITEEEKGNGNE